MERLIEARLIKWKNTGRRKPLIVRGGRQTGKTWSVEVFGQRFFKNMLKIDLEKRNDLHTIFQDDLSSNTVLSRLCKIRPARRQAMSRSGSVRLRNKVGDQIMYSRHACRTVCCPRVTLHSHLLCRRLGRTNGLTAGCPASSNSF